MGNYFNRRQFIIGAGCFGGTVLASNWSSHSSAQTSEPTLEIYLLIWQSYGGKIPWNNSNPREVAEKSAFVVWSYIQEELYKRRDYILSDTFRLSTVLNSLFSKGSIIGHAALFTRFRDKNEPWQELCFSNTGENVGFYQRWITRTGFNPLQVNPRFPRRRPYINTSFYLFDQEDRIMICCYPLEVLAGHLQGSWETLQQFQSRLVTRRKPRVAKQVLLGAKAKETFALLQEIKKQTSLTSGPGGPVHYGLNIREVRTIDNFNNSWPMKTYQIGGQKYPIWGGCANSVASVLQAANLSNMIEEKARFRMQLSYNAFQNAVIPILIGSQAFDRNTRSAIDPDMLSELKRLPTQWGSGNTVEFYDPNYWYDLLPPNKDE
ncbi:hypothetical protein [Anabaena sp. CCY 0017]|uniref:hypothetical protein n=1 Tax=Anabaena sp. CCY 0017 TaxID=3103866 RepID=UPI0039C67320